MNKTLLGKAVDHMMTRWCVDAAKAMEAARLVLGRGGGRHRGRLTKAQTSALEAAMAEYPSRRHYGRICHGPSGGCRRRHGSAASVATGFRSRF